MLELVSATDLEIMQLHELQLFSCRTILILHFVIIKTKNGMNFSFGADIMSCDMKSANKN